MSDGRKKRGRSEVIPSKTMFRTAIAAAAAILVLAAAPLQAQEQSEGLFSGALNRLLRGNDMKKSDDADAVRPAAAQEKTAEAVPQSREQITLTFAPLVRQVTGSVVNVYGERQARNSPFAGDPFLEHFFGRGFGLPRQRNQSSLGSGVIVSGDGIVLTNNHVIANMDEVKVALSDGREFECEIVLKDEKSDLAVLKIKDGGEFEPIEIGDSDEVQVGDLVLAIGNPFGVGQTVTSGIVSAVSRSLAGVNDYGYFIQTDAAINPGNSGGALIDMNGRLIGINTAIYSRTGGSVGLGYAIPSNMTKVILNSARTGDSVQRPWIGATFQNINSEIAESLGLERPRGALVTGVVAKGPAEEAGLSVGDVVLAINGQQIENVDAMGYRLDTVGVGQTARMELLSRGKKRELDVALILPPETVPRDEIDLPRNSPLFGAKIANLSPAVTQEIGLPGDKEGVVVTRVARNSPAAFNGMRPGDIVREVNGEPVKRTGDLRDITTKRYNAWQFVVERKGRILVFERDGGFFRQYEQ
jgi:Do/DeqQ family serine protease